LDQAIFEATDFDVRRLPTISSMANDATKAPLVDTIKMADHDRDGKS
jgi:hypothetical protein